MEVLNNMEDRKIQIIVDEAVRILRENPELTYSEAIKIAKEVFKEKMLKTTYKDSAKYITLEEVIIAFKYGISTEVNDGKDITLIIDKEPTTDQVK